MVQNKKMYILFVVVVVVLLILAALAGAGIAIRFNDNGDDTSLSDNANLPSADPSNSVISPNGSNTPSVSNENASNNASNPGVSTPATGESASEEASSTATGIKVGPYTTGEYYFHNDEAKELKLRASASVDTDTDVKIPSDTKLVITQIIASDVAAYPYWGATSYDGVDGYVAMQFLMTADAYVAQYGEQAAVSTPGNYTVGTYVVSTGGYGVKVKEEPGYGDALTVADDGTEFEVLDIQVWDEADQDDMIYWGHVEWDGWDAYVPMYYMEKAN